MKRKVLIFTQVLALLALASCDGNTSNSISGNNSTSGSNQLTPNEKLVELLSKIDKEKIISYDFTDRSYSYNTYDGSKYLVTGNSQTGLVDYEATHSFNLFKGNMVTDSIVVNALDGVETTTVKQTVRAVGQIYQENDYIYDYFVCDELTDQTNVQCYETDYYRAFDSYLNYLTIIDIAKAAFIDPRGYFSEDSGYEEPVIEFKEADGVETYSLKAIYPGDSTYKPVITNLEIVYNTNNNEFESITMSDRKMFDSLDTDFEIGTASLAIYTIKNIGFGDKITYTDTKYTFNDIPNKDNIHNAPQQVVDLSETSDGNIASTDVLKILRNIYAYSNDIRQTNYSMLYHGAFDFAATGHTEFGDARFEGKIIAYNNGITDNNGYIQKVDSEEQPIANTKANFRIFTKATDLGIFKGGKFDKYITNSFAFVLKSQVSSTRYYLDANPLYWNEISEIYQQINTLNLGKNVDSSGSSIELTVSGIKHGADLEISAQLHYVASRSGTENFDNFTFIIQNDKLMYVKFTTTGTDNGVKYLDTYEARFVHAAKTDFTGEEMDILGDDEIGAQVTMEDFEII